MVIPGQTVVKFLRTCQGFGETISGSASLAVVAGVEAIRAVLEGDDNRCLALGDLRNNTASVSAGLNEQVRSFSTFLDGACEAVPWLCGPFQRRWIAWEGMSSTLVPPSVMTPGERRNWLALTWLRVARPASDIPGCDACTTIQALNDGQYVWRPRTLVRSTR